MTSKALWALPVSLLSLLTACVQSDSSIVVTKSGATWAQLEQDMAQCEYEVTLHWPPPEYARVPQRLLDEGQRDREAMCMRGKGYTVYVGKETERVGNCRLPDGSVRRMSIFACGQARGESVF